MPPIGRILYTCKSSDVHQRAKLAEARAKAMAEFDREGATEKSKQKARRSNRRDPEERPARVVAVAQRLDPRAHLALHLDPERLEDLIVEGPGACAVADKNLDVVDHCYVMG